MRLQEEVSRSPVSTLRPNVRQTIHVLPLLGVCHGSVYQEHIETLPALGVKNSPDVKLLLLALIRQNICLCAGRAPGRGRSGSDSPRAPAQKHCVSIDHVWLRAGALRNSPSAAVPARPAKQ